MPDAVCVTLDVDWAPDHMIDDAAALLRAAGARSTWFVTHASDAVARLAADPLVELGVHPNLLPGTTHGAAPIAHVLELVPGARCVRTHCLVASTPLLGELRARGLEVDSSLYLEHATGLAPTVQHTAAGAIARVPIVWEDDLEMARPEPDWRCDALLAARGVRVFGFHPAHVFLNSPRFALYAGLKGRLETVGAELRHEGEGARTAFERVLAHADAQLGELA